MFKYITGGLLVIAVLVVLAAVIKQANQCKQAQTERATKARTITGSDGMQYDVVIIDGCEYVENSLVGIAHKGNCKSPYHFKNNNNATFVGGIEKIESIYPNQIK